MDFLSLISLNNNYTGTLLVPTLWLKALSQECRGYVASLQALLEFKNRNILVFAESGNVPFMSLE